MTTRVAAVTTSWIAILGTIVLSWVAFALCLFVKSVKQENIRAFLIAEWGLIALPLSVLAVTNSVPILIVPAVALLIAQLAREKPIRRMIAPKRVAGARPV